MMILVVEDDVDLAETCSMVLETYHHQVEIAHSAEEALLKIAERKPDLLISDCVLPGRSGLELSALVRAGHSRNDLPILLMSGSLRRNVAEGDSYDGFINKPFLAEALMEQVGKLVTPATTSQASGGKP